MIVPSTKDTIAEVTDWVVETLPELGNASYDHATDERYKGLPDCAVEVVEYSIGDSPVEAGYVSQLQQIEQTRMKTSQVEVILVVKPEPASEAEDFLKDFSDRLTTSLLGDKTLNNRVHWASDTPRVSFRPPYVEFEDGTQGRICTMYITLGQRLED